VRGPDALIPEVTEARAGLVGSLPVRRALPTRGRRAVGAWCFADHMGPAQVDPATNPGVGPHPHVGLATVTWLLDGELLHLDSLGTEQAIRPGQLNLMTAGRGVQHAEEGTELRGAFEGIQLWVALPDATRSGPAAFEHHAELPRAEVPGARVRVLLGSLLDAVSPARADTPLLGAELTLDAHAVLPLRADFEHAVVVLRGAVRAGGVRVEPGRLAFLPAGADELPLDAEPGTRAMLLGGVPWPVPPVMWWNFVGRDRAELAAAGRDWNARAERFGRLDSRLAPIAAPQPPWPAP